MERLLEMAEDGLITGDYDKAMEMVDRVIEEAPCERAFFMRAYIFYCKYEYDKALPALEYVIEHFPENDEAYYYLSQIFGMQGNFEKARTYIEKALGQDKENIDYLGDYVSIEQALKNYQHCIELCDILLEETPESNFALNARGYAYLQLGDVDKAMLDFKKNTRINPMDFMGWNNLGVAYQVLEKYKDAKKAFEQALRNNPTFSDSYANMGYLFFRQGETDKAMSYLNKALELDPKNADALKKRAELYISIGNKSEARADLIKADELGYSSFYDNQVETLLRELDG